MVIAVWAGFVLLSSIFTYSGSGASGIYSRVWFCGGHSALWMKDGGEYGWHNGVCRMLVLSVLG